MSSQSAGYIGNFREKEIDPLTGYLALVAEKTGANVKYYSQ
jgi:hypothetical protein